MFIQNLPAPKTVCASQCCETIFLCSTGMQIWFLCYVRQHQFKVTAIYVAVWDFTIWWEGRQRGWLYCILDFVSNIFCTKILTVI
jgi:hypothetical protein